MKQTGFLEAVKYHKLQQCARLNLAIHIFQKHAEELELRQCISQWRLCI